MEKPRSQLETLLETAAGAEMKSQKVAFLVLPGSFNPVHAAHMSALSRAREALSTRTGIPVVAGFLGLSQDEAETHTSTERGALSSCDRGAMCSLACAASDWIDVCSLGSDTSPKALERMARQLSDQLSSTGNISWEFEGWWVVGSGVQLLTQLRRSYLPAVCVAPRDEDSALMQAMLMRGCNQATSSSLRSRGFRTTAILVRGSHPKGTSSTIRSLVASNSWEELEKLEWLEKSVFENLRRGVESASPDTKALQGHDEVAPEVPRTAAELPGQSVSQRGGRAAVHRTSGDAAKASQCGGRKVIAHICNDQGNGGRGFFQAINQQWGPVASRSYFEWHRDRASSGFRLGAVQFVQVSPLVEIANMIGQQGSKGGSKGPAVRVPAVEEALHAVGQHAASMGATVHLPSQGLRGDQLWQLLKAVSKRHGVEIYIYT
mmetsp:Transcript_71680/g.155713  ORF Transcript_71680/g.155713 Transcript_71680/m.155713 type:complete len:434 (-) Transcript_71680:220-1521(-)